MPRFLSGLAAVFGQSVPEIFYGYTPHQLDHGGQHQRSPPRLQLNPVGVEREYSSISSKPLVCSLRFAFDLSGNVF